MSARVTTLLSATYSFGMNTGQSMLAKTWRELERARNATSSDDRRDAVINCAITAWHLTDWFWAGLTEKDMDCVELAKLLGVKGRRVTKDDFVKWIVQRCPEMAICQAICNGTKHVACGSPVHTKFGAPQVAAKRGRQLVAQAIVVDSSGEEDAVELLSRVVDFWWLQTSSEMQMM